MTAATLSERNGQAQNVIRPAQTREPIRPATSRHVAAQGNSRPHVGSVTATVRVLTIGTHQMTLAMLRQLDIVSAFDIEPLGRVRTRQDGNAIEVVGLTDGGVLAAAVVRPPSWIGAGSPDLDHACHHHQPDLLGKTLIVGHHGARKLLWRVDVFKHPQKFPVRGESCGRKTLEEQWREEAAQELAEVIAAQNAYDSAKRLPLILVAGMR
jgi:hypothetical protein